MSRRRRRSPIVGSPAASLLPQIEAELSSRRGRFRRRDFDGDLPDDSPGKLYTLVSAGSLELPDDERRRLYTACSRALHNLTLLTTPGMIRKLAIALCTRTL